MARGRYVRGCAALLFAVTATGCAHPLQDLGPLPARSTAAPLPADTVVAELTALLAAEGVTLRRTPQDVLPLECNEQLTGQTRAATADAKLQSAFAKARSAHGWQRGPDVPGALTLRKGGWTASTSLRGPATDASDSPVFISLLCDNARGKRVPTPGSSS
ncbi:hypothetical protein [Streptomyces sp. NPDC086023]|uniref:hypothetical protein n=1 Tax=Streptomyces sp. NPDC086023 TaxID=3365746 RepID=UPI0037D17132